MHSLYSINISNSCKLNGNYHSQVDSSHDLIAEHMADAMCEPELPPRYQNTRMQSAVPGVHSSADSLYHSPSQSSEHLLIFGGDMESL